MPDTSTSLRLLVGLGNPGPKYAATRHNFGFLLLDRVAALLAQKPEWTLSGGDEVAGLGKWLRYEAGDRRGHLLWPLTYMNRSGEAVDRLASVLGEGMNSREGLLVAIDDLSLPLGRLRIRPRGSSGGHNGLKSVEAHLGHCDYARLKLGIGHPGDAGSVVDYVLKPFSAGEREAVEAVLTFAAVHSVRWLEGASVAALSQTVNGWTASGCSTEGEGVAG